MSADSTNTKPRPLVTFDEVWARVFAPRVTDIQRMEVERQTDAMVDFPITLCGETVRQMTAADMVVIDAMGNPFVSGGHVDFLDLAGFVWHLHVDNTHTAGLANLWRRHRLLRRLSKRALQDDAKEVAAYLDRMLLDSGAKSAKSDGGVVDDHLAPTRKVHFLIPLLANAAAEYGHVDPLSGELLGRIPLPRLIQYSRHSGEKAGGEKAYSEIDSLRNRCCDRVNQINWARRHDLPDPVFQDEHAMAPA